MDSSPAPESYRASYAFTEDALRPGILHHVQSQMQMSPSFLPVFYGLLLLCGALGVATLWLVPKSSGSVISAISMFVFVGWGVFREQLGVWSLSRGIRRNPHRGTPVEFTVLPQVLAIRNADGSYQEIPWPRFFRVVEIEEGFLLYLNPKYFFWIPVSAFEVPEGVARLRQVVGRSGIRFETF